MQEQKSILLIGSGVIGSVYGGQLALAGHEVSVLAYGEHERDVAEHGLRLKNIASGKLDTVKVRLATSAPTKIFDIIIVAVRAEQLQAVFPTLRTLSGQPHIIFFGNNPDGHAALPDDLPGTVQLAFPGVGGTIVDGVIEYIPVDQQPTALEATKSPLGKLVESSLTTRGFKVQTIDAMDGWLAHHTVFISCMSTAILKCDGDAAKLGRDHAALKLLCRAISEGFASLKRHNVNGAPKNLGVLHSRILLPIAIWYWGKLLRSPKGELYFAAHARHAPEEVRILADWVLQHYTDNATPYLVKLLEP